MVSIEPLLGRLSTTRARTVAATLLIASLVVATPALAKMYKWVDKDGNVHYSDSVPPDQAKHGRLPPPFLPVPVRARAGIQGAILRRSPVAVVDVLAPELAVKRVELVVMVPHGVSRVGRPFGAACCINVTHDPIPYPATNLREVWMYTTTHHPWSTPRAINPDLPPSPPPFDHSKLMIVDGVWVLLGSANWDPRSLQLNFEFNAECYDRALGERMATLFAERRNEAREVTLDEILSRPLPVKLRDGVARLFSPYL
jgi:hypothetical protein